MLNVLEQEEQKALVNRCKMERITIIRITESTILSFFIFYLFLLFYRYDLHTSIWFFISVIISLTSTGKHP